MVVVGLVLVIVAVTLCLYTNERDGQKVSLKWLFYVFLAVIGNAGCSIVQRTQQLQYNGAHGKMLMLFATGFSALVYSVVFLKSDKSDATTLLKTSWWTPVCAGVCNLILNILVMLMALTTLSPNLIYPVIGVGSIAIVIVFSLLVFKEKMKWWQWIGVIVGIIAIALLSI